MITPALVDRRFGVIRAIDRLELPTSVWHELVAAVAVASDTCWLAEPIGNALGAGCAWWNAEAARDAAIGEALERYAGTIVQPDIKGASFAELARHEIPALDPAETPLFPAACYARPGFPFVPFTRATPAAWKAGTDLSTGRPCFVPLSLVTLGLETDGLPRTTLPIATGIATGTTLDEAVTAAVAELIERAVVTETWYANGQFLPLEAPPSWVLEGPRAVLETRLVAAPNRFGAPVVLGVVRDRETGLMGVGSACRPTLVAAARKALSEAALVLVTARSLADPDDPLRKDVEEAGVIKPFRADRRYLASYLPDWSDMTDLLAHVQIGLDPRYQEEVVKRIAGGPTQTSPLVAGPTRLLSSETLLAAGWRPIVVDLTPDDIRPFGMVVVRVVVPGLPTSSPAAFPLLGGGAALPAGLPLPLA